MQGTTTKRPQSMMLPPPCFTGGALCLGLTFTPERHTPCHCCQMAQFLSLLTVKYYSKAFWSCMLAAANFSRAWRCRFWSNVKLTSLCKVVTHRNNLYLQFKGIIKSLKSSFVHAHDEGAQAPDFICMFHTNHECRVLTTTHTADLNQKILMIYWGYFCVVG